MSFKSKNLQFDANEPAFLRRLRGEVRGEVQDPDRQINPVALPKKPKRLEKDEDDAPTYVLEGSDATISKAEYEALTGKHTEDENKTGDPKNNEQEKEETSDRSKPTQKVAGVGAASRKRKAARVGIDTEEEDAAEVKNETLQSAPKKMKRKPKKVNKLSFADDGDV